MAESIDNEDFENEKKSAELDKLNKEIKKIEAETKEINSKRGSAWAPAVIAICSVFIVYLNGCLTDSKSKLVQEETQNLKIKNDKSRVIFHRDSLILISQKNKVQKQLDSLSQKFIDDKRKFNKERAKYGYVITQKEKEIGGLINEKSELISEKKKIEDCLIKAKEFLKYCIRYDYREPGLNNSDSLVNGYNPHYKTRFNKSLEKISETNIQKMDYSQFLQLTANFTIDNSGSSGNVVLISVDKKVSVIVSPIYGNYKKIIMGRINETQSQFDCYKRLSNTQKLNLLKEMIIRPY